MHSTHAHYHRHALNIDYNIMTTDQQLSYFSMMEAEKAETVQTLQDFMKIESWVGVSMMLKLCHDPFMFHQVLMVLRYSHQ